MTATPPPLNIPRRFLVYGSLMQGFFNSDEVLVGKVRFREPGRVRGMLYHMPGKGYPALVPGDGWVTGELIELTDFPEGMRLMDKVEHFFGPGDPANEYERRVTPAEIVASGKIEEVYVYWYVAGNPEAPQNLAVPIPDGDWRGYMNRSQQQ